MLDNETIDEALDRLFPVDPEYGIKRAYIMQKLREKYPERELLNFHFTPGGPPWATKEQLWEEIDKAESRRTEVLDFRDSRRIKYDDLSESNS
jgi:hypothetical protein